MTRPTYRPTVGLIINDYLTSEGFSGLYNQSSGCHCVRLCGCSDMMRCQPGYVHPDGIVRRDKPHRRCPHCGGQPHEVVNSAFSCKISCRECLAQTRTCLDSAEAWKLWDSRVEATK